jgi:hypothetical protein
MLDPLDCNICFGQVDLSIKLITQYENDHQPRWKVTYMDSIVSKRDAPRHCLTCLVHKFLQRGLSISDCVYKARGDALGIHLLSPSTLASF